MPILTLVLHAYFLKYIKRLTKGVVTTHPEL